MKFPLAQFKQFCNTLVIDSKEQGQITLSKMLGTQRYHLEEVVRGLEDGIHFFVEVKARQLGVTTIQLALDLFWCFAYPGMQATLAADSEENRDMFRSTLTMYHDGLPKTHRIKLLANNRAFMTWQNRSRIFMQIGGGGKRKGGKGRGKGIVFIHGTECSSWDDEESLASIVSSLAEKNPLRLAVWESTARGFDMFQEMYREAEDAVTQRAIFNGWWRNEFYAKGRDTQEFKVYWDGRLTGPEAEWVRDVKALYGIEITPEQIAWWRWKLAEDIHDENYMLQEFPPTAEMAFILTGKNFFNLAKVKEGADRIEAEETEAEENNAPFPAYYRMSFGDDFLQTGCERVGKRQAMLTIWEEPDDTAFYSIGGDPSYGSSAHADRSVVEVYRCYADRFEQVAEFCTAEISTYKYAWVVCFLAGAYKNSMVNVELNGPGEAVLGEIDNLRRQATMLGSTPGGKAIRDVIGHMRYFLYRKLDSAFGGGVYMWKTTQETKDRAFNCFRDLFEKGRAVIHSPTLIEEMKIIVRETDGFLGASGRAHDDCTVATCIAAENATRYITLKLKQMGVTWDKEREKRHKIAVVGRPDTPVEATINKTLKNYLGQVGMKYGVPRQ